MCEIKSRSITTKIKRQQAKNNRYPYNGKTKKYPEQTNRKKSTIKSAKKLAKAKKPEKKASVLGRKTEDLIPYAP